MRNDAGENLSITPGTNWPVQNPMLHFPKLLIKVCQSMGHAAKIEPVWSGSSAFKLNGSAWYVSRAIFSVLHFVCYCASHLTYDLNMLGGASTDFFCQKVWVKLL